MITTYPCGCVYAGGSAFCLIHERPRGAALPPGIAPAIALHQEQLDAVHRLHLVASGAKPTHMVCVTAGDLTALLNAFRQEQRRADQAVARLEGRTAAAGGSSPPSTN